MSYIDLTCPAEIFRTALPTEEIPAATLTLFNLSDRVISSVEILLRLLDAGGGETEQLTFRGKALNGRPHSTFLLTAPCAPSEGLKAIEATVEKVWFSDNEMWRRDPANAVEYVSNALPVSPALTNLKYAAGETAVGYPCMQRGLWVCVCGRPNPEGMDSCMRCGRQMKTVFSRFSPEAVETQISMKERQLDLSSRNMREDTIRLQRIREEEYRQKRSRRGSRIRIAVGMAAAAALTAGVLFCGSPWLQLTAARRALETGDITGARSVFAALGSFRDAEKMKEECDWQLAMVASEDTGSAESLAQASAILRSVTGRPEALEKADEIDLQRAKTLLEDGDWKAALEALDLLPEEYPEREDLMQRCLLSQADALRSSGKYEEARELYLTLSDLSGAREGAALCLYEPARKRMAEKDWDGAIELLSGIMDYSNSRELTLECHYHKAEALLDAGDTEGAGREFLLAGSWSDAQERSRRLIYDQAEALYTAGDLPAAQPLYASIPDYRDANEKDLDCRYTLASSAVKDREYTLALTLLSGVPDSYKKTSSLRAEASYEKAKSAIKKKDWKTAADLLGGLDRESLKKKYKDIEDLYLQACKGAGIDPYPVTPEPTKKPKSPTPTPKPPKRVTPEPTPKNNATPAPFLVTEDDQQ